MTAPMNGLPPHTAEHGDHAHRRGFGALFAGRGDQTVRFDRRDTDRMSVVGRDGGARTEATDGEHEADALRHVVFVGNPNVGKSSLFNTLLGARTKVMNAPGTTVLLETMAGKGSEVGRSFEELRAIIDQVELSDKLGVCLDTCHVSDGGYDVVNDLDGVLEKFDRVIGLRRLKAIHLNDSMNPLGSHKDRHQKLGEGTLGMEALERIVNHPALRDLPFYLETPNDLEGYAREIAMMKAAYKE